MINYFNGLTTVNVELTSRCNKNCWMCGRRKVDKDYPEIKLKYGDMEFKLVRSIAEQLPQGIVVQLHNNGEPLLYPNYGVAAALFERQIRCMDTNGILLYERREEIVDNLDTLTVSTFENDDESDVQYHNICKFLEFKGNRKPNVIIRCLGDVEIDKYEKLNCIIAKRILHSPMGSFDYRGKPTVPEIGICLDLLGHMVIRYDGQVSPCVRFDPNGHGIIGDCKKEILVNIWNGQRRINWVKCHIEGNRKLVALCRTCEFWGVPTGF